MSRDGRVVLDEHYNEAGNTAFKAGNPSLAVEQYSAAIAADPAVAKYRTNRANAFIRLGRYKDALTDAEAAIAIDPQWRKGHYFRALALEKLGRLSEVVQSYKQAVQLDPSSQDVKEALSRCLAAQRDGIASSAACPVSTASSRFPPNITSSNAGTGVRAAAAAGATIVMRDLEGCGALSTEQKFSKARQLCDHAVAAWLGLPEDRVVSLLTAAFVLCPAITMKQLQQPECQAMAQDVERWVLENSNYAEGGLLRGFLLTGKAGKQAIAGLVQTLEHFLPPYDEAPVMKGLLLLNRAELQMQIGHLSGALPDVEAGLQLIPDSPDLLYTHALLLRTLKWDTLEVPAKPHSDASADSRVQDAVSQSNLQVKQQRKQIAEQVLTAYGKYLRTAPADHIYRSCAHYNIAHITLTMDSCLGYTKGPDSVTQEQYRQLSKGLIGKAEGWYQEGLATEADHARIHGKYDIEPCAAKGQLPAMLQRRKSIVYGTDTEGDSSGSQGSHHKAASSQCANAFRSKADVKKGSTASSTAALQRSRASTSATGSSAGMAGSAGSSTKVFATQSSCTAASSSPSTTAADSISADAAINSKTARTASRSKPGCASCGVTVSKIRRCSGCKQAVYCSRECQVADWNEHRKVCSGSDSAV